MEEKNKEKTEGEGETTLTPEEIAAKEAKEKEGAEADEKDIDYKKELEGLENKKPQKTELEKAVFTVKSVIKRIGELGGNPEELLGDVVPKQKKEEDDEEDNKFVTKDEFKTLAQSQIIAQAKSMVGSDDELKLVLWHLENSIVKTGNITEDLETAHILANRNKIKRTMQEIARANGVKENAHGPSGAGQRTPVKIIVEMPQANQDILRRRGFTLNAKTGEWEAKFTKVVFNKETKSWDTVKK